MKKKYINYRLTDQPYHLVTISPWPIILSLLILTLILRITNIIRNINFIHIGIRILIVSLCLIYWFRDIIKEGHEQGFHTNIVVKGIKLGILLFITSEVIFFFRFFWCYLYLILSPRWELGETCPPLGINLFNPFMIPLLNRVILLSSGATVTIRHHCLLNNKLNQRIFYIILTIILGAIFTVIQLYEYNESFYGIRDSIFGSIFFIVTGFHGLHVFIGTLILLVRCKRIIKIDYSINHHLGFETAAWYWHFVDVVWLFLYLLVYYWIF